jgi:uncharacterized membrane protein YsdA (DUF1294 family)
MKIFLILFAIFNLYTFGLTAWDKYQARQKGWRVAESRLKKLSWVGGSLGMVSAMQLLRHKTSKNSFYLPVYLSFAVHIGLAVWLTLKF